MLGYYARDGRQITLGEWQRLFSNQEYKRVEWTAVGDVEVSTVWLGLDHGFGQGPPVIFETMTFGSGEQMQWRWSTEEAARAGHERIVTALRAGDVEGAR